MYLQQLPISHIFIVLGRWREEHSFPADSLVLDHTQSSDLVLKPFVSHSPIHCVRKYDVLKEILKKHFILKIKPRKDKNKTEDIKCDAHEWWFVFFLIWPSCNPPPPILKFYHKHTVKYPCPFGSNPHGFAVFVGALHFCGRDCTQTLTVWGVVHRLIVWQATYFSSYQCGFVSDTLWSRALKNIS